VRCVKKYALLPLKEVYLDIADLYGFYEDIAGKESADRFEGAIQEVLESLAFWPNSHPVWDNDPNIRRINMLRHNVSIIYIVDDDKYRVIAIKAFHTLQNPETTTQLVYERLNSTQK